MKFVHIADMHFDTSFENLSQKENLSEIRRLEQRKVMKKIIDYCKDNEPELLLISGDLYEAKFIKKSSIEYINELFKQIPKTKIFISPGNHDPYLKNSFYNTFDWNDNVYIFKDTIEKIKIDDNTNIYGYGFTDFYCYNSGIENIKIDEKEKNNILIVHASLDGANDSERNYNGITSKNLKALGFDYVALGHIHKRYDSNDEYGRIVYPGSTIGMGFDELGEHGMIVGTIENKKSKIEFIKLDDREYKEYEMDITEMQSKEDIIERISEVIPDDENFYKVILVGYRNFEIKTKDILKITSNNNVIKIKDNTKIAYNLDKLRRENNIKGIYINKIIQRGEKDGIPKDEIEKMIEIGLDVLS